MEEHGFPLYRLADAVRLRNHVLERFEATDADPSLLDHGSLTFVVVGGGPTGVEVAGALAELIDVVLRRDFKHLDVSRARVVLVEMLDDLLTPFSPVSRRHARETLEQRGVEIRTGTQVASVSADQVELAGGEVVAAQTLVWAAGVKANAVAEALGLPVGRGGRVEVGRDLAVVGHSGVWAVGDIAAAGASGAGSSATAALPAAGAGGHPVRPPRRRPDLPLGRTGRPARPFRYRDKGTMATIGRGRAVAELPLGVKLRGLPAWMAWLALHLVFLAGFRNRISVFVNWAWNYLTWDRGPRLILTPDPADDEVGSHRLAAAAVAGSRPPPPAPPSALAARRLPRTAHGARRAWAGHPRHFAPEGPLAPAVPAIVLITPEPGSTPWGARPPHRGHVDRPRQRPAAGAAHRAAPASDRGLPALDQRRPRMRSTWISITTRSSRSLGWR